MSSDCYIMVVRLISICVVLLCAGGTGVAQQKIRPEKAALIRELLEITSAKKNALTAFDVVMEQSNKNLPDIVWQAVAERMKSLTPEEQAQAKKIINDSAVRLGKRTRELIAERIDFGKLIDDVYYPLLDKAFTDEELQELNAFYKSTAGAKAVRLFPTIYAEAVAQTDKRITPLVAGIVNEVVGPESKQLEKEIAAIASARKPAPKATRKRKQ